MRKVAWNCFPTGQYYPGIAEEMAKEAADDVGIAAGFDGAAAWLTLPWVVIDFETTGLDATQDRVLEMGMVCVENGEIVRVENLLINPQMPVPEESRAVHGITDEELADAPTFEACVPTISELLRDRVPVAYNANFDRGFLVEEWKRVGASTENLPALDPKVSWIDPLVWVRELQKYERGKKLTDVCERMGISLERAHRASGDAEATAKVLTKLAPQLPANYAELVRIQQNYGKQQEREFAAWRARKNRG